MVGAQRAEHTPRAGDRAARLGAAWKYAVLGLLLCLCGLSAQAATIELPEFKRDGPIDITAEAANVWSQGAYEVWLLRGNVRIEQGKGSAQCKEAVLWVQRSSEKTDRPGKVIAYLEGAVEVVSDQPLGSAKLKDEQWFGRFHTAGTIDIRAGMTAGRPDILPMVFQRAMAQFEPEAVPRIRQAQFLAPIPSAQPVPAPQPVGTRRIRAFPRSNIDVQAVWFPDPSTNQWIAVISSGVNLIVDGIPGYGAIDVSTDRLVIWTRGMQEPDLTGKTPTDANTPLEIYMEGNIIFRQGERVITADRMYYDVTNRRGTILNADILTPVKSYEGLLRLHSDIVSQTDEGRFFARNSFLTSSRLGDPSYRIQMGEVEFQDRQVPAVDPISGQQIFNAETGAAEVDHERLVTASNNVIFAGPLPVFYWPRLTTDAQSPTLFIRRIRFKNDQVFGTQVLTDWNMYELLGIRNKPEGTTWEGSLNYLSKRGPAVASTFAYRREDFLGLVGPVNGVIDSWFMKDWGFDNLGSDRSHLKPTTEWRGRFLAQHRQYLANDWRLTVEGGVISDDNFLQEYFQYEWFNHKNPSTGIELKNKDENATLAFSADVRVNDFFTATNYLPRVDHFWIGQPLLGDWLTWYEHSDASYAQFRKLDRPGNPADQPFTFLPWEVNSAAGQRLVTRQEIDAPLQLGVFKVVPYALGEVSNWGQDIAGDQLTRLYGQAGVRASLPFWRADPTVESTLWNVHGLAHKIEFDVEAQASDANQPLDLLPLYEPVDDWSIEAFRRRLAVNTFHVVPLPGDVGVVPARFQERYYALRTGLGSWVASPSTEIADRLATVRLGVHQRWQTKRGMPGNRKIIDWITLDTNITLFPNPDRDNFGSVAGLLDYDARWHVGDRLTLCSDGIFDFFSEGQKIVSFGAWLNRPPRGSIYLGMRILEGPIDYQILNASYAYWMSPKWVSTAGISAGIGKNQTNLGENFSITRVGESLLISAGFSFDATRNSSGVLLTVEPRFLPKGRLGNMAGVRIPPAGAFGLE